jgi:hypothetical protein
LLVLTYFHSSSNQKSIGILTALTLDDDDRPPPVMSKYDPDLDYEKLLCDLFDEEEKNCPDIKK